jgi:proteasome-associated ATPase
VRWDRNAAIALEKIERSKGDEHILTEYPDESFDNIGGLGRQIHELQQLILLHFLHPAMAEKYGLRRKRAVTLIGPPGTGKTMLARALAAWLGTRFGTGKPRFMHIKPSSLNSYWFSKSEANYREVFRVAREAGAEDPSVPFVIFFDEVDAVAGHRGHSLMRVDDRVLTAFMAELDGLETRGNVLVIAATNRQDSLDPAILRPGRLGDLILEVPRPNLQAAQAIFSKYLEPSVPYRSQNGHDTEVVRTELIESAVSRLYDPNAENGLANLTFRDGTQRMVKARDLVSGANISKIAGDARERACRREVESGESGVTREDLLLAVNEELDCMSRMLTPANCRSYLSDLPTDLDVVRVDSVRGRGASSSHYLRVD